MEHITQNTKSKTQKNRFKHMIHDTCYMLHASAASRQRGMTLIFTIIIMGVVLVISLAVGVFGAGQMRMIYSAKDSSYAIFGGTTGIERALDIIRNEINTTGSTVCDVGTEIELYPGAIFPPDNILTNLAEYRVGCYVKNVPLTDCDSGQRLMIISNGTYRQTTRKIEANFCR